jgi:phage terminase small subunit
MRTGRPPKPTALKLMTGNPGRRPLPKDEPAPPKGDVLAPAWLKRDRRSMAAWNEYAPKLIEMGVLTVVDVAMFAAWCSLYAEFQKAPDRIPANRIARMDALAGQFGLNPSARARMGTKENRGHKDPAEAYFASDKATG